jgi:hypothetical protein
MLIEEFMHNGSKGKEICELNKCRLYLQCANLADITNGKGDKILTAAIQCRRSPLIEQKQYEWPTQPAPYQLPKLLWRKALHKCFTQHRRTNVLRQLLGTWYSLPSHLIRYNPDNRMYPLRLQQDST